MAQTPLKVRRSILEIQNDFTSGKDTKTLEDLMTAWAGIKALPANDVNSFFMLGGFHGEPFRGPGETDGAWWGGYCMHGNVLFPTWHRVYLYKLELALQSIVPGVMLPYWDETDAYSLANGIPSCLTNETFTYSNGTVVPNPLKSFILPMAIIDQIDNGTPNDPSYSKPKGYETVRYPLSGLVGTPQEQAETTTYNKQFNTASQLRYLNGSVVRWLNNPGGSSDSIYDMFKMCLTAPNYTVFSNTTSYAQYNNENPSNLTQPLEQPHNDVHISVGGPDPWDEAPVTDANGDMGENDTAGLDPIFYFHHCNVDRMFWVWQKQNGFTDKLDIIAGYPGTKSSDAQGPTPGYSMSSVLDLNSPLYPFTKSGEALYPYNQKPSDVYTSMDCINIETQLGFTYSIGSLDNPVTLPKASLMAETPVPVNEANSKKKLFVSNINRGEVRGSFVISAYITVNGKRELLGHHSVLSRKNVKGCANCLTHLEVNASFRLNQYTDDELKGATFDVEIHGKEKHNKEVFSKFKTTAANEAKPYTLEVK